MADLLNSYLKLDNDEELCLLCQKCISYKRRVKQFENDGWQNLKGKSVEWKDINIPENDSKFMFTTVYSRIKDTESAFGNSHENCRITFLTKSSQSLKRHGYISRNSSEDENIEEDVDTCENASKRTRSTFCNLPQRQCFICCLKRISDEKAFNEGGIGRCQENTTEDRLFSRTNIYIRNKESQFHEAALRLQLKIGGSAHDIYAAGIYYHQSCYIRLEFVYFTISIYV